MSKIPTVTFKDYNPDTIRIGLELPNVQSVVLDKLYTNFIDAVKSKRKTVTLCKVKSIEDFYEPAKHKVVIERKNFQGIRKKLLNYYQVKENYDECVKLRDLNLNEY